MFVVSVWLLLIDIRTCSIHGLHNTKVVEEITKAIGSDNIIYMYTTSHSIYASDDA